MRMPTINTPATSTTSSSQTIRRIIRKKNLMKEKTRSTVNKNKNNKQHTSKKENKNKNKKKKKNKTATKM